MSVVLSPERGPRRPLLIRFALGGIHSRRIAWRYVWISAGLVILAVAVGDPTLIGIALLGLVAFGGSIWWMDRHDAWDDEPTAPAAGVAAAVPAAPAGVAAGSPTAAGTSPAIEGDRATAATAGGGLVARLTSDVTTPSRSAAVLGGMSAVVYLFALVTLEAAGPAPTGGHLVAVVVDALFGVVFGGAATYVALRRPNVPFERVTTVLASIGLALIATLGFYVASDGSTTTAEATGLGAGAAALIFSFASAAAFWLTARSGGRLGWLLAIPVLLVGWILGLEAWVAHVNSPG